MPSTTKKCIFKKLVADYIVPTEICAMINVVLDAKNQSFKLCSVDGVDAVSSNPSVRYTCTGAVFRTPGSHGFGIPRILKFGRFFIKNSVHECQHLINSRKESRKRRQRRKRLKYDKIIFLVVLL